MTTDRELLLEEALRITTEALEISLDWNGLEAYDIAIPKSWEDTKDPATGEPDWPSTKGIINKCQTLLTKPDAVVPKPTAIMVSNDGRSILKIHHF